MTYCPSSSGTGNGKVDVGATVTGRVGVWVVLGVEVGGAVGAGGVRLNVLRTNTWEGSKVGVGRIVVSGRQATSVNIAAIIRQAGALLILCRCLYPPTTAATTFSQAPESPWAYDFSRSQ